MSEEKFYAGFWVRFFAGLLDIAFLTPLLAILIYTSGINESQMIKIDDTFHTYTYFGSSMQNHFVDLISYGLAIAYAAYFLSGKKQATFGKRIMGIYVGNRDGSKLNIFKALARALASILTTATCGLGFVIVIFTKEKIALHDFICKTRVFHGKK